jgi:hypothetical protein
VHIFDESWAFGSVREDLGSFGTEGGEGRNAGVVGQESCYQGCEGCC